MDFEEAPPEACWRIFGFIMHSQSHVIHRLPVHLPGQQSIVFDSEAMDIASIESRTTKLMGFFNLCSVDENARNLPYHEIPLYYVWKRNEWVRRQRKPTNVIGRMYTVSTAEGERYYLRMLLCHVNGPCSFEDLRTYNDCLYDTFQDACVARGLLENYKEWLACLNDAVQTASPHQLRQLFATIIVFCQPSNPADLFNEFLPAMSIDFANNFQNCDLETLMSHVASDIDSILRQFGLHWASVVGLPHFVPIGSDPNHSNSMIQEELAYDREILQLGVTKIQSFNGAQAQVFETVRNAVEHPNHRQSNLFLLTVRVVPGKHFCTMVYRYISDFSKKLSSLLHPVESLRYCFPGEELLILDFEFH